MYQKRNDQNPWGCTHTHNHFYGIGEKEGEIVGNSRAKRNNSSGITLIALVVSIVVLIILAVVSINVIFGENGIISRAELSKEKTEIARIKEEAELVKADLIIDNLGSTVTKSNLIIALKEHFEGSTLENGRVVVENGKYDIVVKNNLDIVVVKHGEDVALSADEIGIRYEVEEVNSETKKIKVYLDVGYKTYEEYAAEFLADKGTEELEELLLKSMCYIGKFDEFLSENNMTKEQLEQQAQDNGMTYDEYLKLSLTEGEGNIPWVEMEYVVMLAGGEGKDQTGLENLLVELIDYPGTFDDIIVNELKTTRENFLSFAQEQGFRTEEDFVKILICESYPDKAITVVCSNGETVTTDIVDLYAEFTVTEDGTYTITATTDSGKSGEATVEISGLGEKFSQIYQETAEYTSNGKTAWIPAGFAVGVSEGINSIDSGLVITDSVDSNGYSNGNEFVWVPVDVDNISDIYDEANNAGQLWSFSGTTSTKRTYPTKENNGYREPDVVAGASPGADSASGSNYDAKSTYLKQAGFTSDLNNDGSVDAYDFKIELQNEFDAMIASVREYGGFYIGRYETGNLSQSTAVVQKGNTDIGSQTWYKMYAKCKTIGEGKGSVTSSMIWGSLWDATLRWMQTSSNPEVAKFPTNSTGKGNYAGTQGSTNKPIPTGTNPAYSVNNIYDMAGNVWDWTLEAKSSNNRMVRGGGCGAPASSRPASFRFGNVPTDSNSNFGCRSYLYVTLGAKSE